MPTRKVFLRARVVKLRDRMSVDDLFAALYAERPAKPHRMRPGGPLFIRGNEREVNYSITMPSNLRLTEFAIVSPTGHLLSRKRINSSTFSLGESVLIRNVYRISE